MVTMQRPVSVFRHSQARNTFDLEVVADPSHGYVEIELGSEKMRVRPDTARRLAEGVQVAADKAEA